MYRNSRADIEVAMFGKILAHRLDERFLDDQEKLVKDTVALLECYFKVW